MAQLGTGSQGRRRNRAAALQRHSSGATSRPDLKAPTEAPAARAAREIAQSLGDVEALEEHGVPSMDYLCPNGGQMVVQAGVMFCVWE